MPQYQLQIWQRETYPRCRIYREFFQTLTADRDIHTNGCPGLFCYTALCSLASPHATHLRLDGISYTVHPGECICLVADLTRTIRLRSRRKTLELLRAMEDRGLLRYSLLGRGKLVRYKILDWDLCNRILAEVCSNQNQDSSFCLPTAVVADLIGSVKCSEMDILLDLLCSAVYMDKRVKGSFSGQVVYFRNGTGSATVTLKELCSRWGLSPTRVRRVLRKLERTGFITLHSSPHSPEMLIYLVGELAASFQVSDVLTDKDELPMTMRIPFPVVKGCLSGIRDTIAESVLHLLDLHGIGCAKCQRCTHELYLQPRNPAENEKSIRFRMEILCGHGTPLYSFDLLLFLLHPPCPPRRRGGGRSRTGRTGWRRTGRSSGRTSTATSCSGTTAVTRSWSIAVWS